MGPTLSQTVTLQHISLPPPHITLLLHTVTLQHISLPPPPITLPLHSTLALKCQGFKHPVGSVDQCFVWGTKCLLQCLGKHRVS